MASPWWCTPATVRATFSSCRCTEWPADRRQKPRRASCPFLWERGNMSRIVLLLLALHAAASGKDLRIGVFGLFHPSELILRAASGRALRSEEHTSELQSLRH